MEKCDRDHEYMIRNGYRETVEQAFAEIIDNNQEINIVCVDAAHDGVLNGMGSDTTTVADYRLTMAGRGGRWTQQDYADVAGVYIRDAFLEELTEATRDTPPWVAQLLIELLDLNDRSLREMIGQRFLPSPDDLPDDGSDADDEEADEVAA